MKTTWFGHRPATDRAQATWAAISPGCKLRRRPMRPVAQNGQPMAQPACEERHNVSRLPAGMSTASIWAGAAALPRSSSSPLTVPSGSCWRARVSITCCQATSARASRSPAGRSVMARGSVTPWRKTHRATWSAR
ncbi:hypothetical protein U7230_05170 [Carboxydochorda subterranea]|uniref:Uncharacterized protein n=1 Tax=Carboxydichorda subterranea TaxID=3109565 RepID=A0ABZ1BZY7_9FIRM|nr:hypothetical protein [Limnochorda sp. L945t]WRP18401.1 hypothetical protein U7230_05170 [Limnochorda sp. L945t]